MKRDRCGRILVRCTCIPATTQSLNTANMNEARRYDTDVREVGFPDSPICLGDPLQLHPHRDPAVRAVQ